MYFLQIALGGILFAAFGFIISLISEERPVWLIDKDRFDKDLHGRWSWLHPIVGALSFVYNGLCMGFFGLIKCAEWFAALLKWLKYWLWERAFMWIWREVIVAPVVLIAKIGWYYLVVMPWEIVKQSLRTIPGSWSWSVVQTCWKGVFVALVTYGLFATLAEGLNIPEVRYLGALLAMAPITWTVANAVSRHHGQKTDAEHNEYSRYAAIRFLKYSGALIAALVVAVIFIESGNIESIGIPLFGLLINASHLLFAVAIFVGLILAFSLPIFATQGPSEAPSKSMIEEARSLVVEIRNNGAKHLLGAAVGLAMACIVVAFPAILMTIAREGIGVVQDQLPYTEANVTRPSIDSSLPNQEWMSQVDSAVSAAKMQVQIELLRDFPDQAIFESHKAFEDNGIPWVKDWHMEMESNWLSDREVIESEVASLEGTIDELRTLIALEKQEGSTYVLQRKASGEEGWQTLEENISTLGFKDNNLSHDARYSYRVQAQNAAGESSWSYPIDVTTPAITLAPPSRLKATAESNFRIVLRWNDNSWNEDAFLLERSVDKEEWSTLARLESDTSVYIDSNPLDTTQYYRISAINSSDTSKAYGIAYAKPVLSRPYGLSDEATYDAAVVTWEHSGQYNEASRSGRVTENVRPTLAFTEISALQHLTNELEGAESELAELTEALDAKNASINQRLAHLEPFIGKACVGNPMRYLNSLLSWIALALLWGFVAAFGASYAGKQLMVLKNIGQAEGFFFIDRINEARQVNKNQPLMGLLLLLALLFILSGPASVDVSLPEFEIPSLTLEMEEVDASFKGNEEAVVDEEAQPSTYVLQGKGKFDTLWAELSATFGSARNVRAVMNLNDLESKDHVSGKVVIVPEGLELP